MVRRWWWQRHHRDASVEAATAPAVATVAGAVGRRADRWPSGVARAAKPWQGHGGHGQPVRGHARAHSTTAQRFELATRGDHAHGAIQYKVVTCTNFKALITTKPLLLNLNRLHYTQDAYGTTKSNHSTTPLLNPISLNKLLNIAASSYPQSV